MSVFFTQHDDIGFLEFNLEDSKVNLLNADVLKKLDKALDEVANHSNLKALVIHSAKKDCFIAGADIKEIEKIVEPTDGAQKAKAGQDIMNKIEDLTMPTIAVIDGVALGGGCELALACHYRISTFNPKVMIGLPEVRLGFVPGFGGTYRLPRVVGLQQSLKMITMGGPIDGARALRCGLVDQLYPSQELMSFVNEFVRQVGDGKIKKKRYARKQQRFPASFLDNNPLGQAIVFSQARKLAKGPYPAPLRAINVISQTLRANRDKGMAIEREGFGDLAITDISKNLVQIFYLNEKFKKLSLPDAKEIKPQTIHQAGVLGAGIMGGGIAQLFSSKDIWTRIKDINHDAVAQGFKAAAKVYQSAVKKRKLTKAQAMTKMGKISGTLDYSGFSHCDIVIEAVVEKMEVKKKVFKELSDVTKAGTILATNTSALSVTEMAKDVKDPAKVIGIHFFNPVHRMPLIEIITTEQTSKETIVSTLALVRRLGKIPILVKDSCGFVVNRILLGYINEAGRIIEETDNMAAIEQSMLDFGMPMGPFTLSDEVGLDVGIKVLHILEEGLGKRFKAADIYERVFEKGLLGKKSQKGFFIHGKRKEPNSDIQSCLEGKVPFRHFHEQDDRERLIFIMINEAAKCLEDGIVDGADSIDVGMIFGTGFPPFKGGLLRYADQLGMDYLVKRFAELEQKDADGRFQPAALIKEYHSNNKGFYS